MHLEQLLILFRDMSIIEGVCFVVGLVLTVIEIFQLGSYVFGIIGGLLLLLAGTMRVIDSPDRPLVITFLMVLMVCLFIIGTFFIMVRYVRFNWLKHASLENAEGNNLISEIKYDMLLGKMGTAQSALSPVGIVDIEGVSFKVVSEGFIKQGETVRVITVEGERIFVKRDEI